MVKYPLGSRTKSSGYTWKLCPYSSVYADYYYNVLPTGISGPSNHPALFNTLGASLPTTVHSTTDGTMQYSGAGWICKDPACYYYVTTNSGVWYYER